MESLTLPKRQEITFDRSDEISGASEQSFWNSRFYRVCRVKVNEALKPEYLLKRLKMKKKKKKKMFMFRGVFRTAATSKMQHFVIIVNSWRLLTIITKSSKLDVAAGLLQQWWYWWKEKSLSKQTSHINMYFTKSLKTRCRFLLLCCFFELPKALHREPVHIFCPKNISILVTLETVCQTGIRNLDHFIYL